MNVVIAVVAGWFAVSVPVGLVIGRMLARASQPLEDDASAQPRIVPYRTANPDVIPFTPPARVVPDNND